MSVTDFNHVELLLNSFVKSKFLFLDLWNDISSQIDCTQVQQLLVCFHITCCAFYLIGQSTHIVRVLEERTDSFPSLVQRLNVLLSRVLFFGQLDIAFFDFCSFLNCVGYSLEVEEFALDPVVDIHESIAQIGIDVVHRLFDVLVVWVVEYELTAVVVRVVRQV